MAASASRRRSFLQYLADNNPFYLLSAASMLCACLLLSNTTTWSPIALHKLLGLIGTLSLYELLLVGLGLFLIARRGHARDGIMLLVLEAFFLADVGFLASEAYQESLAAGLLVSCVLMMLALVKLGSIFHVLRMPIRSPVFTLTILTVATLLFHPALFKQLSDKDGGHLSLIIMYAAWWSVGLLLAAYGVLIRFAPASLFRGNLPGVRHAGIAHVLLSVMLASLIAHLGTAHWVYNCLFVASDASPIMAALAMLIASFIARVGKHRQEIVIAVLCLVVGSVITANDAQTGLTFRVLHLTITPIELALAAAYLALVYLLAVNYAIPLVAAAALAIVVYQVSPTWNTIHTKSNNFLTWIVSIVDSVIPYTREAWGGVTLFGAFGLLGVGAYLSLLHGKRGNETLNSGDAPPTLGSS